MFLSQVLGERRFSGLTDVSPVVAFPLPYGIGVFLRSTMCPDTDSSVKKLSYEDNHKLIPGSVKERLA